MMRANGSGERDKECAASRTIFLSDYVSLFFYSCFSALSPGVFSAAQLRPNEFLRCELTLNYARARGEPGNFLRAPDLQWPLTRRMCAVYAHDISILDLRVCARTRSRHTRSRSRLLNVE